MQSRKYVSWRLSCNILSSAYYVYDSLMRTSGKEYDFAVLLYNKILLMCERVVLCFGRSEQKTITLRTAAITDYIGTQIQDTEHFKKKQARYVRDILNESTRFGMSHLSASAKRKAAWLMLRYRMTFGDAYALYGKYIGNWGGEATVYRFEAIKDGKVVRTVYKSPFTAMRLHATVSHTELVEGDTYDAAAVRLRMTDQNGNLLPFFFGAVSASVEGEAEIIGPSTVLLRGGCGGIYIKTKGRSGKVTLTLRAAQTEDVVLPFTVTAYKEDSHD